MTISYTTDEVFGITRHLPLNYVEREAVDQKLQNELCAKHHIVIYGSSKQGKTSVRKHCLPDDSYILVQCSNKSDMADLHANILKRAGFEITQSSKKSSSGKNKVIASVKTSVKGTIFGFGGSAEAGGGAEGETGTTEEIITVPLEIDIDDVNDVIAALKSIEFDKLIVLEDFHYLPYETQKDFSIELKAFHEFSTITFIVVGVWLEDNRLIVYNGDLTGRVISVNADHWSNAELQAVIARGGALLGVTFDDGFASQLIGLARESVYVVQEGCRRACHAANIHETQQTPIIIGAGLDVDVIVKSIVDQQSARYDSFLTNFADGFQDTDLQMYRWLLYTILSTPIEEIESGLRYRDIRGILSEKHPRKAELNAGNIIQALQSSASLQVKKNIMPIIIDYDQSSKNLHVVDKGFIIWLQHQDLGELLSDIGVP